MIDHKNDSVKEIKILTGLYNNEREINEDLHKYVVLVTKELEQKGISLENACSHRKDRLGRYTT